MSQLHDALPAPYSSRRANTNTRKAQSSLETAQFLARWLDTAFYLPGSKIGVGLDAIIGLIPGGGDFVTALASLYILSVANRHSVPRVTQLRMALNIAIDAVVGAIPLTGDLFDVYWKANRKNVELLERHLATHGKSASRLKRRDGWFVAAVLGGTGLLVLGTSVLALYLLILIGSLLTDLVR
jgi:hypothetical protein